MSKKQGIKIRNKKIAIAIMEYIITLGCLLIAFVMVNGNKIHQEDSYAKPEAVSKYEIKDEYITRVRPLTEYESFKEIAENSLNRTIRVYKNETRTEEVLTGNIKSGMIIDAIQEGTVTNTEIVNSYKVSVVGDLNNDGDCNVLELTKIIRSIIGLEELEDRGKELSADFNGDDQINVVDVTMCINYIVYGEIEPDKDPTVAPQILVTGDGNDEWYKGDVNVKIIENGDKIDRTVSKIEFKLKDEDRTRIQSTKSREIVLSDEGTYKITSQSYGTNGTKSEEAVKIINIDKTQPIINIQREDINVLQCKLIINVNDDNLIKKYSLKRDGKEEEAEELSQKEFNKEVTINENGRYRVIVEDFAGNTTTQEFVISDLKKKCTVVFKDEDDNEISREEYIEGERIVIPEAPEKEEDEDFTYEFKGWEPEIQEIAREDIEYTPVYESISKEFTVTFYNEDRTEIIDIVTFKSNATGIDEPIPPEREGYVGLWTEYELKNENTESQLYYVEKKENGIELQATDKNGITWNYTYQDGKAINVYYESGNIGKTVEIPFKLDDYPVESIGHIRWNSGYNMFYSRYGGWTDYSNIEKIIVPYGVKEINERALSNTSKAIEIDLPDSVEKIKWNAFYNCGVLNINLGKNVNNIDLSAFENTDNLYSINVSEENENYSSENGILFNKDKTILYKAPAGRKITNYTIPEDVTTIGRYAFERNTQLESIALNERIERIEEYAFSGCYNLKEIRIPNSIEYIDVNAFQNCDRLSDIYIDDDRENVQIPEDYRYKAFIHYRDCKHSFNFEIYKENLRVEEITNSIENNEVNCGDNCSFKVLNENNEVVSDEVVIVIAQGLYTNSENKTGTIKPNEDGIYTVRNIDRDITITIGRITDGLRLSCDDENGLTWNYTYQDGNAVNVYLEKGTIGKKVKVPSELEGHRVLSIENIERDDNVFDKINYDSNYERDFNPNVEDIDNQIEEIELPEGLLTIGRYAFYNMRNLKKISLPESLINIGDYAFNYCNNINSIEIPNSVTNIGRYAFRECYNLNEINIPEGITEIKDYTFSNCNRLKKVTIPEGVTTLGNHCFAWCYDLNEVILPESLITMRGYTFENCNSLKSIIIPKNVETIENNPFNYCHGLKEIKVDAENNYFADENGILYNKEKTILLQCPISIDTEINIPNTVTTINNRAFYYCSNIEYISLPSSVTTIYDNAFYDCYNLKEIELSENITSIEYYTFAECRKLKEIRIPESVTHIDGNAFNWCYELADIYIDNLRENVDFNNYNNGNYPYIHYRDCRHNIELKTEGVHLEEVEGNLIDSTIQCGGTYKFKVIDNETNEVIKDKLAIIDSQGKFTNQGKTTYAIYSDEEGIYTIENINRNLEISIDDIRDGLKLNAVDTNGIIWSYTYEDGKATQVHYASGELGEIVEIPSELNSYPVESLYNSSLNGEGSIFAKENYKSNTQINQIIIPESVHIIGRNAFYGCVNIKNIEIPSSVTKIEYGMLSNCIKITDIYIDNLEENVEIEGDLNGYGYVHFSNCRHDIAFEKYTNQYVNVETIEGDSQDEHIECRHDYKFRLLDRNGNPVTTERVLVRYAGIETELDEEERDYYERVRRMLENSSNMFASEEEGIRELQPQADGTYCVERVHRNITIIIGSYQTTDTNGITWNYSIKDGNATNVYYAEGPLGETVEIPDVLEGHPVYSLYNKEETGSIFAKAEDTSVIKNIVIKNGLEKIDKYAFYKLDSVETIEIPDSVTEIGYASFYDCENIENLVVPRNVVRIGKFAFSRCKKMRAFDMPDSVTQVGIGAFSTCEELETINLSSNIEILPDYLFSNCEKLKSIEIPDSITVIGKRTFNYCCSLENIVIPDTVTLLGESALSGCLSLKTTQLSNNIEILDCGVFSSCQSLSEINIPSNIKEIRGSAFENCYEITEIEIPSSVKKIGIAFSGCKSLKDIFIDNNKENVTTEEYEGKLWYPWYSPVSAYIHYKDCTHSVKLRKYMEDNTIIESVSDADNESIPCKASYQFKLIKDNEVIQNKKIKITELGITNYYNIEKEIEPDEDGVYTIEKITKNIEIPIGDKVRQATDNNGITWEYTYENGKATNVHYLSGGLGTYFEIPSKLDGYPIVNLYNENSNGEAIGVLGGNWSGPISIKISEGIKSIDKRAFYDYSNLRNIELPKSLTNIGEEAFYNCYNLKSITIPKNVKSIERRTFIYCTGLESVELPNGLTNIGEEAFYNCYNIRNINLPNNIKNIGRRSFYYCNSLETIELPSELKVIEQGLFRECYNLKNITIKGNVEKIEEDAFCYCNKLEEVILPDSVKYINRYAFGWCSKLSNITIPDSVVVAGYNCIEGTPYYNNLPNGEMIYLGSAVYKFKGDMPENTVIQIREGAQVIPERIFEYCDNLVGVELPDSIIEIGDCAFKDCKNLRYVEMSRNTKCIGGGAFENCTSLSEIVIWRAVEELRERTFDKWKNNQTVNFEVEEVQEGWDENWNRNCNARIVFGYTGE